MTSKRTRAPVSSDTEAEVLRLSGRRCCLCFGLFNRFEVKRGQIAHLDRDPSNNDLGNLAFLCLDHHDEYDTRTSQSKGIKRKEVLTYRASLYAAVQEYLNPRRHELLEQVATESESPLASTGELEYYLATFDSLQSAGLLVMARIGRANQHLMNSLSVANTTAMDEIRRGIASLAGQRRYYTRLAGALSSFAPTLNKETEQLALTTTRMLDSLSRAAAVASDIEMATPEMFDRWILELDEFRDALSTAAEGAVETSVAVRSLQRGTTKLNKGRRLTIVAFDTFAETIQRELAEVDRYDEHLKRVRELL